MAIKLANAGDLLGIFQFDSPGIRKLAKGNVKNFDDLVAYSALYRPGPLGCNMHTRYVERMHGREECVIHPVLQTILGKTYGVMVFQEQVMQVLNAVGRIPLKDGYDVIKAISKKKIEKFAKYRDVFILNGQEVLGVTEDEMVKFWDQIESFAGYGFNKSHSVAYTYISSRLLYLKAHYPIEFYTATLQCEKTTEKMREYMIDARQRGIHVEKIDINQSQENFVINAQDDKGEAIYYGFAKLKGLGEGVALRIVANQKYGSFEEFLSNFGTEAKVLTALISLGAFGQFNRDELFKFYEHYKDWVKKKEDRGKRYEASKLRHHDKLRDALKPLYGHDSYAVGFSDDQFELYARVFNEKAMKPLEKLRDAYYKCIETYEKKMELDQQPTFAEFKPEAFDLDEKWEMMLSQPIAVAEKEYYGFRWTHPMERSPDYDESNARTFHAHRHTCDDGERTSYVEVEIEKIEKKPTKKGGWYYLLTLSDVMGEGVRCNVWEDDFERFEPELVEGNLVKMMLDSPDAGFPTYKLHSPPRHMRHKLPPKNMDFRVIVYRKTAEDLE
jgi:DNA polymerase III alpha subunit